MFHVFFGLPYYWVFMAYPSIFPQFCEPRARTVTQAGTLYHCTCVVQVRSRFTFLNYLQICEAKRDMKHVPLPGRVTGI